MQQILGGSCTKFFLAPFKAFLASREGTKRSQRPRAGPARQTPVIELLIYFPSMYLLNEGRWLFNK